MALGKKKRKRDADLLSKYPYFNHLEEDFFLFEDHSVAKKQQHIEQDRTELARICQMLIDELNECEARVKVAEAVIGDLKNTDLIDMLTRNERMKDSLLQEIEDLQDRSQQLDQEIQEQDKQIDKLETFINSENGLNQQKVADLENELLVDEQTCAHLEQVIEELKRRTDTNEEILIKYDSDLVKKTEDFHDLNIRLVDSEQEVKMMTRQQKKVK